MTGVALWVGPPMATSAAMSASRGGVGSREGFGVLLAGAALGLALLALRFKGADVWTFLDSNSLEGDLGYPFPALSWGWLSLPRSCTGLLPGTGPDSVVPTLPG